MRYAMPISIAVAVLCGSSALTGFWQQTRDLEPTSVLNVVYRASLAAHTGVYGEGGLVDGHWVSVNKDLVSIDDSGYTLSFTQVITDAFEDSFTPNREILTHRYHFGAKQTARVSFSDVHRIRLIKEASGRLLAVFLLGATGELLDGFSSVGWVKGGGTTVTSGELVAALHALCPNAIEENRSSRLDPGDSADAAITEAPIGRPFKVPNDSVVGVKNTGIMLLLKHMGSTPFSADVYVVSGATDGQGGIRPYKNDRTTSDRYVDGFRSAHKSCDGSLVHSGGYEVRCYHVIRDVRMDHGSFAQSLGTASDKGKALDLFAVHFGTNWVEVEAFEANR